MPATAPPNNADATRRGERRRGLLSLLGLAVGGFAVVAAVLAPDRPTVASLSGFSPGGQFDNLSDEDLARDLDVIAETGVRWVRVDLPWNSVERQQGQRDWTDLDRMTAAADERGIDVLALVAYTPQWARPGCDTDKCPPDDPAEYADFLADAAARYGPDLVSAWEIWNEPNVDSFWAPEPDPEAYAALLARATAALRDVRPDAFIVSGGLSPAVSDGVDIAPLEFVERLYALQALDDVDAVGIHPYSATALPLAEGTEKWNTFLQMEQVHEVMARHGDGDKPVWATEFGVATGTSDRSTSQEQQAAVIQQGFERLGDRTWPWLGTLFVYSLRDSADDLEDWQSNFGLLRHDGEPKPAFERLEDVLDEPLAQPDADPQA